VVECDLKFSIPFKEKYAMFFNIVTAVRKNKVHRLNAHKSAREKRVDVSSTSC
jgi:hypothetical protein